MGPSNCDGTGRVFCMFVRAHRLNVSPNVRAVVACLLILRVARVSFVWLQHLQSAETVPADNIRIAYTVWQEIALCIGTHHSAVTLHRDKSDSFKVYLR